LGASGSTVAYTTSTAHAGSSEIAAVDHRAIMAWHLPSRCRLA
jgi:hypothetical protein